MSAMLKSKTERGEVMATREIIKTLLDSPFYLGLYGMPPAERLALVKHLGGEFRPKEVKK
jgi:hypothetical protein